MENNNSTRLLLLLLLFLTMLTIITSSTTTDLNSTASELDYSSLSGEHLLPSLSSSPPFMPVGDTSGSIGWEISNCIGLMLDFYALLLFFMVKDMLFGTVGTFLSLDEYWYIFCWCSVKALLSTFAFNVLRQIFIKFR